MALIEQHESKKVRNSFYCRRVHSQVKIIFWFKGIVYDHLPGRSGYYLRLHSWDGDSYAVSLLRNTAGTQTSEWTGGRRIRQRRTEVQTNSLGSLGAAMAPQRCAQFRQGTWALVWVHSAVTGCGCCPKGEDITLCKAAHLDHMQVPGTSSQHPKQLQNVSHVGGKVGMPFSAPCITIER